MDKKESISLFAGRFLSDIFHMGFRVHNQIDQLIYKLLLFRSQRQRKLIQGIKDKIICQYY